MANLSSPPPKTPWLPLSEAVSRAVDSTRPKQLQQQKVPLEEALGRICSQDIIADIAVPPCDNSAMDGYAVNVEDCQLGAQLTVSHTIFAGDPPTTGPQRGCCARIMTGAPIPSSCNAVIMQENVTLEKNTITINTNLTCGENIRVAGNDIQQGDKLISAGTRITPRHLMLLASLGSQYIDVWQLLRVGIISTGNELVKPGEQCQPGQIFESNSVGISALLAPLNVVVTPYGIIKDDQEIITQTFIKAAAECDLVISSGGVSVGDADLVKSILDELGTITYWKVAIKPGKPFAFGYINDTLICGVPGNPVSAYVTTEQIVIPVLRALQKESLNVTMTRQTLMAKLQTPIRKGSGRLDFQRAWASLDEHGDLQVIPLKKQSSGVMSSVVKANCYLLVPAHTKPLAVGDKVSIQPFDHVVFTQSSQ
jgi:molybdopterin molybdotransferase